MGSYDGAETCVLVGSFLLSQLQHLDVNIGLYRDDGLAISNAAPRDTENIKKEICHKRTLTPRYSTSTREQPSTDHHKEHTRRHHQTAIIPFVRQSIIRPSHPPPPRTKKHSTKADTTILYTMNRLQLLNGETDNATTSSGTTPRSAKTSTPPSVTDSSP
ncbi:unnamed protein product [Porites lobata]|uniref:Uncharacterized protein n=1 Tax=Porites lobata TaxID=104759 RepID=A0ABN8NH12_9CNID|nr:unnamed protein product [Porites lobata]